MKKILSELKLLRPAFQSFAVAMLAFWVALMFAASFFDLEPEIAAFIDDLWRIR